MNVIDKNIKLSFIGGDERSLECAKYISKMGYEVAVFGFDSNICDLGDCTRCGCISDVINGADIIVLPMPVTRDGENLFLPMHKGQIKLCDVFSVIDKAAVVLGGNVNENTYVLAGDYGIHLIDYFDREEVKIANAYLTAESAISIALQEKKDSLRDGDILVMGYGRIGKILCSLLKSMGANVYASARKKADFEWIRAYGYSSIDTSKISQVFDNCRLIFNTIPESVLTMNGLCKLAPDTLVIDLASKPGGVDFEAAKQCGIKVIWALGLPGKMKQVSAGRIIAQSILTILEDEVNMI